MLSVELELSTPFQKTMGSYFINLYIYFANICWANGVLLNCFLYSGFNNRKQFDEILEKVYLLVGKNTDKQNWDWALSSSEMRVSLRKPEDKEVWERMEIFHASLCGMDSHHIPIIYSRCPGYNHSFLSFLQVDVLVLDLRCVFAVCFN